jgi:mono/diheme cytochrome c family protein
LEIDFRFEISDLKLRFAPHLTGNAGEAARMAQEGARMKRFRAYRSVAAVALAASFYFTATWMTPTVGAQEPKTADAPAGNAENGKRLFTKDGCYECHGREGQGSTMSGPRIAPDPVPLEVILRYVRKPTGEMPPYSAKVVSDQDLADIYAFLASRPHPPTAKASALLN